MAPLAWSGTRGGLCLADMLRLSFQRYLAKGPPESAPPSLGALPVAPASDEPGLFLVPLHPGEAVWIGLLRESAGDGVVLKGVGRDGPGSRDVATGAPTDLAGAEALPAGRFLILAGLPRPDGLVLPFSLARGGDPGSACASLRFCARTAAPGEALVARVEFVAAACFGERTGETPPGPADPDGGYKGWLLP